MRAGWNGASPSSSPPRSLLERLRLAGRAVLATMALAGMLGLFLVARCIDLFLRLIAGRPISRFGPRIVQAWARLALPILGLKLRIAGTPMQRPGVYIANHASWIDIIALQAAAAPFLVSKAEVRDWPAIGLIGRAIGTLFIDRHPTAAYQQETALRARMIAGDHMALFPEGTSSDGQRVLTFKSSLFAVFFAPDLEDLVTVQPVVIRYRPRDDLPASFYAWWGDAEFGPHISDVLARSTGGKVHLSFLEPLPVGEEADRKSLARAAEAAVRLEFERLTEVVRERP